MVRIEKAFSWPMLVERVSSVNGANLVAKRGLHKNNTNTTMATTNDLSQNNNDPHGQVVRVLAGQDPLANLLCQNVSNYLSRNSTVREIKSFATKVKRSVGKNVNKENVKKRLKQAKNILKSDLNKAGRCIKYLIKNNPYEFWYNRSTRRRARRRAQKRYKHIVKTKYELDYDVVEERLFDEATSEAPTLESYGGTECETETDEETSGEQTPFSNKGQGPSVPTNKSEARPVNFARGERARQLAAAAELNFGALSKNEANKEIIRRFMARHELVTDFSVRFTDRLALSDRALQIYFIRTENDLVNVYTIENAKNTKRHKQMAGASC